MKHIHTTLYLFLLITVSTAYAQKEKIISDTRQFIDNTDLTQINRDFNNITQFKSGLGETVDFYPIEVINLKTNQSVKSLQIDMSISNGNGGFYYKYSWIDSSEIEEFIYFLEQYVIPNLEEKIDFNKTKTYIVNLKEITFNFRIAKPYKRVSIYLKDNGITDSEHYFWTETQVSKIPDLLNVLKRLR